MYTLSVSDVGNIIYAGNTIIIYRVSYYSESLRKTI